MGTGKTGRYLNTNGSARSVSNFALVHSNEGTFTYTPNGHHISKLKSGGHGQAGMNLLARHNIPYHVVKTYQNGVRIGNVPGHKDKNKRTGIGQAWFPKTWTAKDIKHAGEHVAGLKHNRHSSNGQSVFGTYKGVRVGVKRTNGRISTIFPDSNQSSTLKRRRKK